jgi:hypothetical protein
MNKRPKSREETPKEGSDSARRYRTATICDRAAQNARVFETFPVQKITAFVEATKKSQPMIFSCNFIGLTTPSASGKRRTRAVIPWLSACYPLALDFVIDAVIRKFIAARGDTKVETMLTADAL